MKKFYLSLTLIALALIALSCTQMLPDRVERFVDRVEKNASTYTEEDWERASEQFTKLADEYKESYDKPLSERFFERRLKNPVYTD